MVKVKVIASMTGLKFVSVPVSNALVDGSITHCFRKPVSLTDDCKKNRAFFPGLDILSFDIVRQSKGYTC